MLIPVATPVLLTDITEVLELIHMPPTLGNTLTELPTHTLGLPGKEINGAGLMVMDAEESDTHPDDVSVNINLTVPAVKPDTTPLLLMVATEGLELIQVPPVEGCS